jgi:MarR family transcriptional regulator, lower aerobic nicotinate degradation pathway regulator
VSLSIVVARRSVNRPRVRGRAAVTVVTRRPLTPRFMSPPPARMTTARPPVPESMRSVTGYLANQLAERLRDATEARLDAGVIRPRQIGLLLVLRDEGPSPQQLLGERLGMDRTTSMQLVSALEAHGLARREADPADGRAYLVRLTPRGRRMADECDNISREAAAEVLRGLSASESRTLQTLLLKALDAPASGHGTAGVVSPRAPVPVARSLRDRTRRRP